VPLQPKQAAKCSRCGAGLYRETKNSLDRTLALSITGLVLFILANIFPLMTFQMQGRSQSNTLISGVLEFISGGFVGLGILVFLVSILIPFVYLAGLLYVLLPLKFSRRPWKLVPVFKVIDTLRPWAMIEIYMLGIFVAIVKLADFATIDAGIGLFAFAGLFVVIAAASFSLDPRIIWEQLDIEQSSSKPLMNEDVLVNCHHCDLLISFDEFHHHTHAYCPRCDSKLHRRIPNSLARSWAFLIAAAVLYIPANVFPVMTVISFGQGSPDTIMSGVVHLAEADQWPIAILVFVASIFVPILKILLITFLLISVQFKSYWRPKDRTVMYRLTELVGRWSMIDIFMISILIGLVKLGAIATIEAGIGATAFAAVVVLTMFSANYFDSRLIWDNIETRDQPNG